MAKIQHITVGDQTDDSRRHLQALTRALEEGTDLGPRGSHIQAIGESLESTLTELQQRQMELAAMPEAAMPEVQNLLRDASGFIDVIEDLLRLVRALRG